MKKSIIFIIIICFVVLNMIGCSQAYDNATDDSTTETENASPSSNDSPTSNVSPSSETQSRLHTINFDSVEIEGNPAGISSKITLYVYLPPSYYTSEKHYPVVYYLHGYSQSSGTFALVEKNKLDRVFEDGADEFIVVDIEGRNSFYVNSPVTGNWENYIINEAIPLIDKTFRTLPDAQSRGICGFSMGGFGSMNLAMRNPDVFGAVYSGGPGMLAEGDLQSALDSWKGSSFMKDYARAFAPDLTKKILANSRKWTAARRIILSLSSGKAVLET